MMKLSDRELAVNMLRLGLYDNAKTEERRRWAEATIGELHRRFPSPEPQDPGFWESQKGRYMWLYLLGGVLGSTEPEDENDDINPFVDPVGWFAGNTPTPDGAGFLLSDQIEVAGVTYNNRQEIIKKMPPSGVQLELKPEPGNPHDSNAIGVFFQGRSIGYVPSKLAKILTFIHITPDSILRAELRRINYSSGVLIPVIAIYKQSASADKPEEPEIGNNWRI
jgi:hypothetical protein